MGAISTVMLFAFLVPPAIHLSPLLVAAPTSTAPFARVRFTAGITLAASAAVVVIDWHDGLLGMPIAPIHVGALLVVSAFVIVARTRHDRDLNELIQVRAVSEAAQQVLLRPIPARLGPLRVACSYQAAAAHASVGGDLYAADRTARTTRFLIGDVRGKGLPAIGDASALLAAFRETAHRSATLAELAASLEGSVRRHLTQLDDNAPEADERFITALLVEIPDDAYVVRLITCGHPLPLCRHCGRVTVLDGLRPAPPFGLAGTSPDFYQLGTYVFAPGDTLLLYTDGVTEARNPATGFYPLLCRAASWRWESPPQLLQYVGHDLLAHSDGHFEDDLALVAVQRTLTQQP
ncbi:PP2C family protein-serine/threonine phosphatase [Streptomyces nodosus]|uniref:PP2C family protein-serine/threonine phosphatase n=1 Tax=Streptomyces nodosus TaxID=40318 RepID=UPI00380A37BE